MKLKKTPKVEVILLVTFRVLLLLAIIGSIIARNWLNLFTAILTFICTALPFIIARKNRIILPTSFQVVILIFIFAALYLGELKAYYIKFLWWDTMLHTFSGIILGFVGFLLVYVLNKEEKVNLIMSPFFVALFSLTFAITVGVIWEIFEFFVDNTLGLNMQKSGLVDTMWDLILDSLGALFTSFVGYFYQKRKKENFFNKLIKLFLKINPDIFLIDSCDIDKKNDFLEL